MHVIDHHEGLILKLSIIYNLVNEEGILKVEVTNIYGFTFNDRAYLINFKIHSLRKLLNKIGFLIIDSGYISNPRESFYYDYQNSQSNKNIYCPSKTMKRN